MKNFIKKTGIITLGITIAFIAWVSIQLVYGWAGPTTNPPNNNLPIPIITGRSVINPASIQEKSIGNFTVGGIFQVVYDAIFQEFVGIGTNTPIEKLHLKDGNFLLTFDSSNLNNLTQAGVINNTLPDDFLSNARGVYVSGKYAYIIKGDKETTYTNGGLTIIDISNPSNPIYVGSVKSSSYLWFPSDVQVVGKYAYVTAFRSNSLTIIDVSNPSNPVIVGWYKNSTNLDGARYLKIVGKYAYVTASAMGLSIIDISNPANPTFIKRYSTGIIVTAGVYVSSNYAYVTSSDQDKLVKINISDPLNPFWVGEYQSSTYLDGAWGVYVSGNYAYVTAQTSDRLTILDVSGNNPIFVSSYQNNTYLDLARGIQVSGKYAYIGSPNQDYLTIFDISNPNDIKLVSVYKDYPRTGNLSGIFVSGKYIYIPAQTDVTVSPNTGYLTILDPGIDAPSATIGNISASQINVSDNMDIGNNLNVTNGVNVGPVGIKSDGNLSISGRTSYLGGTVGIGTTNTNYQFEVVGGPTETAGGLVIEIRTSDPTCDTSAAGRMWLRTDIAVSLPGIGLRVCDGTNIISIFGESPTISSLRITRGGIVYGIVLVDPSDLNASKLRINTNSGVRALKKI